MDAQISPTRSHQIMPRQMGANAGVSRDNRKEI